MPVALALVAILAALLGAAATWPALGPGSLLLAPFCASGAALIVASLARHRDASSMDADLTSDMVARLSGVLDAAKRPVPTIRPGRTDAAA